MRKILFTLLVFILLTSAANAYIMAGVISGGVSVPKPNAPTAVAATFGATQNTITWTASAVDGSHSAATSYDLIWGLTSGSESTTITGVTSGYVHSSLTNGTPYYYLVRANNSFGTALSSEVSAVPMAATDTDFASYTNENSGKITSQTTTKIVGTSSMQFVEDGTNNVEMYRAITFPATGTYTFSRWFYIPAFFTTSTDFHIFSVGNNFGASLSAWDLQVAYHHDTGTPAYSGISTVYNGIAHFTAVLPETSMTTNTWYRVVTTVNLTANQFLVQIYNTSGALLASSTPGGVPQVSLGGKTLYSITGRSGPASSFNFYLDGLMDGL